MKRTAVLAFAALAFFAGCVTPEAPEQRGAFQQWKVDTDRLSPLNPSSDITLTGYNALH